MYNTSEAKVFNSNEGGTLTPGIYDNVSLNSVRFDKSPNTNSPFIEISFIKDGAKVTKTEWEPTKFGNMTDEDLKKKVLRQVGRMQQILESFYEENDPKLTFTGTSFAEFAKWFVTLMENADKTKVVKLKVVYDDKGFATLPSYARYKFIEPMVLPEGKESKIKIESVDKMVRPIREDKEESNPNPITASSTSMNTTAATDLPF